MLNIKKCITIFKTNIFFLLVHYNMVLLSYKAQVFKAVDSSMLVLINILLIDHS